MLRKAIFVTTKLYSNQYADPEDTIEECLRKLDIGYLDLILLHHPGTNDVKAYKAMEKYVKEGKIEALNKTRCLNSGDPIICISTINCRPGLSLQRTPTILVL